MKVGELMKLIGEEKLTETDEHGCNLCDFHEEAQKLLPPAVYSVRTVRQL
jgi:hypothetical protein